MWYWKIRRAGELSAPCPLGGVARTPTFIPTRALNGRTLRTVLPASNGIWRKDRFLLLHELWSRICFRIVEMVFPSCSCEDTGRMRRSEQYALIMFLLVLSGSVGHQSRMGSKPIHPRGCEAGSKPIHQCEAGSRPLHQSRMGSRTGHCRSRMEERNLFCHPERRNECQESEGCASQGRLLLDFPQRHAVLIRRTRIWIRFWKRSA